VSGSPRVWGARGGGGRVSHGAHAPTRGAPRRTPAPSPERSELSARSRSDRVQSAVSLEVDSGVSTGELADTPFGTHVVTGVAEVSIVWGGAVDGKWALPGGHPKGGVFQMGGGHSNGGTLQGREGVLCPRCVVTEALPSESRGVMNEVLPSCPMCVVTELCPKRPGCPRRPR